MEEDMKQANTSEIPAAAGALRIFVYGTLKQDYWNHDRFCRGALYIEEATVQGRLYDFLSRFPVLQVPEDNIIAVGTLDPLADVATQERLPADLSTDTDCDEARWQMIQGELLTFPDPQVSLPPIDRLEGFQPGLPSLYRRVLVPVMLDDDRPITAWCYVGEESLIRRTVPTKKICWP
jgi:gamma-glutamylcyclotransferase (GGCT)/AIG2-like uncharacterized protein YtfP